MKSPSFIQRACAGGWLPAGGTAKAHTAAHSSRGAGSISKEMCKPGEARGPVCLSGRRGALKQILKRKSELTRQKGGGGGEASSEQWEEHVQNPRGRKGQGSSARGAAGWRGGGGTVTQFSMAAGVYRNVVAV